MHASSRTEFKIVSIVHYLNHYSTVISNQKTTVCASHFILLCDDDVQHLILLRCGTGSAFIFFIVIYVRVHAIFLQLALADTDKLSLTYSINSFTNNKPFCR